MTQLEITIGTPAAAIPRKDDGTGFEQLAECGVQADGVGQGEVGRLLTNGQGVFPDGRIFEFIDEANEVLDRFRRGGGEEFFFCFAQLCGEGRFGYCC